MLGFVGVPAESSLWQLFRVHLACIVNALDPRSLGARIRGRAGGTEATHFYFILHIFPVFLLLSFSFSFFCCDKCNAL